MPSWSTYNRNPRSARERVMTYERYRRAESDVNEGLIRHGLSMERDGMAPRDLDGKMAAMRSFLSTCGNPQQGIPAVHVAGTSGKGSVCAAIAGILSRAGFRVGLHVSPYLQSATEKIWVAGRFVSPEEFADLVEWVLPKARPLVHPDTPASPHGMASVAIAMEGFRRAEVDVMVFEAGCGGRYDLSSFLDTTVSVVTNIGLDHVVSLGPGIEQIAWHKAGVARRNAPLVTGATGAALAVIVREAAAVGAPLVTVPPAGTPWDHNRLLAAEAARSACRILGRPVSDEAVEEGCLDVKLAGRREEMPSSGPVVVMDGAHNPEKLACALDAAASYAVKGPRICLFGAIGTKAGPDLVAPLRGRFDRVVTTEPPVYGKRPYPADEMALLCEDVGLDTLPEPNPVQALDTVMGLAGADGLVFVTGSFYLVGALRESWYPRREVVLQGTSFPRMG